MGVMTGLMAEKKAGTDGSECRWDQDQCLMISALLDVARHRGVNKRHFWKSGRPITVTHSKGSDLDRLVPVIHVGRLAVSVADEVRARCGGFMDVAVFLKRSMPVFSLSGTFRLRGLW